VVLATGSVSAAEAAEVPVDGDQLVSKPFSHTRLKDAVGAAARHADAREEEE
jgi:hypothetical protein